MHAGMTLPVLNNTSNKRKQLFSSISSSQDNEMILTAEKDENASTAPLGFRRKHLNLPFTQHAKSSEFCFWRYYIQRLM